MKINVFYYSMHGWVYRLDNSTYQPKRIWVQKNRVIFLDTIIDYATLIRYGKRITL